MSRSSIPSPDEALAGMAKTGSPRTPMGREGAKFTATSAAGTGKATLVPKKNSKSADPANPGSKANRQNVPQTPAMERKGAAYTIKGVIHKPTDPAAGMTQANGRIVSAATNRDRSNFDGGAGASY